MDRRPCPTAVAVVYARGVAHADWPVGSGSGMYGGTNVDIDKMVWVTGWWLGCRLERGYSRIAMARRVEGGRVRV